MAALIALLPAVASVVAADPLVFSTTVECYDLFGRPLYLPVFKGVANESLVRTLETARHNLENDFCYEKTGVHDPELQAWVGRRIAYQWRYNEAIQEYSNGIADHRTNPVLLRHRGHRYLSIRKFAEAAGDLDLAAAQLTGKPDYYEEDGQPNQYNLPVSTFHSNVYYHEGLAHLFQSHDKDALSAFEKCMTVANANDDQLVATSNWYWITLMKNGMKAEAAQVLDGIKSSGMQVLENGDYYTLLKMYKKLPGFSPEEVLTKAKSGGALGYSTIAFGVGNYYDTALSNRKTATAVLGDLVANPNSYWAAFGYIAAEAQLQHWGWAPNITAS